MSTVPQPNVERGAAAEEVVVVIVVPAVEEEAAPRKAAAAAPRKAVAPAKEDLPIAEEKVSAAAAAAEEEPKKKVVAAEEDPRLRWAFVRKVYGILALQFTATSAIAAVACFVRPIPRFFTAGSAASWVTYIAILLAPLVVMWPMLRFREKHPVNLLLLGPFTLCSSLSVAICASFYAGIVVLQSAILTAVAVIGLTLFTFRAAKKGYDFTFMSSFLSASLPVLFIYLVIQIFIPLGSAGMTVYGCVASIVFSAFIVYDTHRLLKHHAYSEYVVAAISLYLDVINLFMAQLSCSSI